MYETISGAIMKKLNHELEEKKYKCEVKNAEELMVNSKNAKDPVFLANLMFSLKDERERSNNMIATVIRKIEALEMKVEALEQKLKEKENSKNLLGEVDSDLLKYVRKKRRVCAVEVQKRFNYKGRNAASSRLHKLYSMGYLDKKQVGRRVYYFAK